MLDDRSYMRGSSFDHQRSATLIILAINIGIFVFEGILNFYAQGSYQRFFRFFALSTDGLGSGYVWQLFSYQFMHANFFHLLVNGIIIFFFGRALEETLGRREFLKVYLGCGVAGGLLQVLFAVMLPGHFGGVVVGASAAGLGLVAAFARMFPERQITLLIFFVIPVSFRAKFLLWGFLALSIFGIIVPADNVAHAAHLGGLAAGVAYVHFVVRGGWSISFRPSGSRPDREMVSTGSPRRPFWQRPKNVEQDIDLPPGEFISKEVDPILDKISAHGIHSLTERERKILEAARAKMAKR
jgi:membrane associated rhomboid family serine protease